MADSQAIARRLESLHMEGLPPSVEEGERERLRELVGSKPPRGAIEHDKAKAVARHLFLSRLWHWHRRRILASAEGAVTAFGERRGKHDSKPPASVDERLCELEAGWQLARTNTDRRKLVEDIQELHRDVLLPKQDPALIPKTEEWRRAIAHDPRPSRTVGRIYGITHTQVLNYRAEFAGEAKAA